MQIKDLSIVIYNKD